MQDMYRRTLAAYWTSQPGELKADECIEDIFGGGDGWGKNGKPEVIDPRQVKQSNFVSSDNNSRPGSGSTTPNTDHDPRPKSSRSNRTVINMATGRQKRRGVWKGKGEVDECDVCDDLKSWRVGERAYG